MQKSEQAKEPKDKEAVSQPNPLKRKHAELTKTSEGGLELNKWWEKEGVHLENDKNDPKWEYFEHNGVLFPPFYKPHKIRINHKGEPIALSIKEEELATYWSQTVGTEWERKPAYRQNFSKNFLELVKKSYPEIKNFDDLDFGPIVKHLEVQKEIKRNRGPEEKKVLLFFYFFLRFKFRKKKKRRPKRMRSMGIVL